MKFDEIVKEDNAKPKNIKIEMAKIFIKEKIKSIKKKGSFESFLVIVIMMTIATLIIRILFLFLTDLPSIIMISILSIIFIRKLIINKYKKQKK